MKLMFKFFIKYENKDRNIVVNVVIFYFWGEFKVKRNMYL